MNRAARASAGGFTLVELIIALTIIGILSAALFSALRISARSWEAGERRITESSDTEAVRTFLRGRLLAMELAFIADGPNSQQPAFLGLEDQLRFAAPMPPDIGMGGLYLFSLGQLPFEQRAALDWQLIRDRETMAINDGRLRPRPLLEEGAAIAFRYFGIPAESETEIDAPFWSDRWGNGSKLPLLIEMRFYGHDREELLPPLRVAPVMAVYGGL